MIRLCIFDLDGVLTESKDTHYKALNKALEFYNQTPITYQEHISTYDGKPTKVKLELRNIDSSLHDKINKLKQEYTIELLEQKLIPDEKFIDIFKRLKEEGYFISIASNSIRYTVELILFKLGIRKYVDYIVSNQDAELNKPHSEMYLKCMLYHKVNPRETIILEDSYFGRQGAFNSGAFLCAVKNPEEVTYEFIKNSIRKANGEKQRWKGNNMNILIPMAGAGSRFVAAGYTFPKPLIDVNGKSMIQVVVESLNMEGQYIFIVRKEHYDKYNLKYMLEMIAPNCKIVQVDHLTEGAACTTLLAKELINNNEQLFIANADQWIDWDSSDFMYSVQGKHIDGGILTFYNTHPMWSYAKVDENNFVTEVKEKLVISTHATTGHYHWSRGSDYVKYAEQMIQKNIRVNNEFYNCPVYNEAIQDGKKFKIYEVKKMFGMGIPEDLNMFLDYLNRNK
jgi:beta-phosphoglucomutase-like phosphatase (HAD superfamily)/dTDP-glucose pyrophosphorylase